MTMDLFPYTLIVFSILYQRQYFYILSCSEENVFFIVYKIISEIRVSDFLQLVFSIYIILSALLHVNRNKQKMAEIIIKCILMTLTYFYMAWCQN